MGHLRAPSVSRLSSVESSTRRWFPEPTGGDDTAELESRINAGEKEITLRSEDYRIGNLTALRGASGVHIRGVGVDATSVTFTTTTGKVIDMDGASFCEWSDMTIAAAAQKTAGELFYLDDTVGSCQRNEFHRLRIFSAYRAFHLVDCTTTTIEEIQFGDVNASWTWDSALRASGGAISTVVNRLRGGTAAGMTSGVVKLTSSSLDTFHGDQWDLLNLSPSTGMLGLVIDDGQWIKLRDVSIECGDQIACTINGGRQVHINDPHFLNRLVVAGGTGLKVIGGETLLSNVHGVQLAGGTDTLIDGLSVHDIGAGWNAIDVSNGVSDFTIVNCDLGRAIVGATQPATLIRVGASANAQDRYKVAGNRGRNFTGTSWVDNGTGTNKDFNTTATGPSNIAVA